MHAPDAGECERDNACLVQRTLCLFRDTERLTQMRSRSPAGAGVAVAGPWRLSRGLGDVVHQCVLWRGAVRGTASLQCRLRPYVGEGELVESTGDFHSVEWRGLVADGVIGWTLDTGCRYMALDC